MTNNTIQRPDPAEIARLIETDELLRYAVEKLGGRIIGFRNSKYQTMPTEPPVYQLPLIFDVPLTAQASPRPARSE